MPASDRGRALLGKIEPLVCRMVVMTAYGTGLRISEALALETRDIDGKAGILHVRQGKGGRPRLVMLPRRLLETLARVLAPGAPAGSLAVPGTRSEQATVPRHGSAGGPLRGCGASQRVRPASSTFSTMIASGPRT